MWLATAKSLVTWSLAKVEKLNYLPYTKISARKVGDFTVLRMGKRMSFFGPLPNTSSYSLCQTHRMMAPLL